MAAKNTWSSVAVISGIPITIYLCQPHDKDKMAHELEEIADIKPMKGKILEKIMKASPYNILENTLVYDQDQNQSVSFPELFDESLGELESSLLISNSVDLTWILFNYCMTKNGDKPLTIVVHERTKCISASDRTILDKKQNINVLYVNEIVGHNA